MFAATRRWFRRNRTTLAIGAGTVGAVYLAGQYAWGKWLEARQKMGEERSAKENLRRRFEQNQEDCTYTVLALLPTFKEEIIAALPAEDITAELQKQKQDRLARSSGGLSEAASSEFPSAPASTIEDDRGSLASFQSSSYVHTSQMADSTGQIRPRKSKVQLWNDLKITSITRSLTLLYTLSLLTLLTRIQLNLLGRRTYLSSVVSLASPNRSGNGESQIQPAISLENNDDDNYDNVYGNDFETNRKYLTFSWWLLHRGSKDIMERVQTAVKAVFGPVNPREDITLERLSQLILEVRKKVEGATEAERKEHKWLAYLLPPREEEDFVLRESGMDTAASPNETADGSTPSSSSSTSPSANPSLRRLLDETSDLIDSPTFTHVLTLLLNATFSHLIDQRIALEAFKLAPTSDGTSGRFQELDAKCKVAQTLAVFCRQAHVIAAGGNDPEDMLVGGEGVGGGNEYLAKIDKVGDLEGFAAVIYSSNFEFEGYEEEQAQEVYGEKPVSDIVPETPTNAENKVVEEVQEKTEFAKEQVENVRDKAVEVTDDVVEGAQEKAEDVKEKAEDIKKQAMEVKDNVVEEVQAKTEDVKEQVEDVKEELVEVEDKTEEIASEQPEIEIDAQGKGFEDAWKQALDKEDGKM